MVTRNSQTFGLQSPGVTPIQTNVPGGTGVSQDIMNKYNQSRPGQGGTQILDTLYQSGAKLSQTAWEVATQEAYLQGAAQEGLVAAEADLESNPITKDWTVAGYRDTTGKIRQAELETQFLKDLPELRTKAPEEVKAYLQNQRKDYSSTLDGMSRQAREGALTKRLTYEQNAIAKYSTERTKYITQQRSTALRIALEPAIGSLERALTSGNEKELVTARAQVVQMFSNDIWNAENVSAADKQVLASEFLDRLFVTADTGVYQAMINSGVIHQLPAETQTKYAEKLRDNLQKNNAQRFMQYREELGKLDARIADHTGDSFPSQEEMKSTLTWGVLNGALTNGQDQKYWDQYYGALGKRQSSGKLTAAVASGDAWTIRAAGKTVAEAFTEYEQNWIKQNGKQPDAMTNLAVHYVKLGTETGFADEALKRSGQILGPAISAVLTSTTMPNKEAEKAVTTVFDAIKVARATGKSIDNAMFLTGIREDQREAVLSLMEQMNGGAAADSALSAVREKQAQTANLSPSAKEVRNRMSGKSAEEIMSGMRAGGWWNDLVAKTRETVGLDATARRIRPNVPASVEQQYMMQAENALSQELTALVGSASNLSVESMQTAAMAGMHDRMVRTEHGPSFLLRGTKFKEYFKLPEVANMGHVEQELNMRVQPTVDGASPAVSFENGNVMVREFNKNGKEVNSWYFPASEIGAGVEQNIKALNAKTRKYSGEGVQHKDIASQESVTYNGRNAASVDDALMFKFRKNLVVQEGVKKYAYLDKNGKNTTVGVGITDTNDFFPKGLKRGDPIDQATIDNTFRDASNAAAIDGVKVMTKYGLNNDNWFLLASELAYQAGRGNLARDSTYVNMFNSGYRQNKEQALQALRSTPAYGWAGKFRKQHYEQLLNKAMEG